MRISEIMENPKFRDETELMLFHGTSTKYLHSFVKNGVGIVKLNKKKDFGQGFYLTTNYWQAKDYANRTVTATSKDNQKTEPLVIACTILLGRLREELKSGLIIDEFDVKWLEIIIRGRFHSDTTPLRDDYDWIYGKCGDGITTKFEKLYRQQEKTDLNSLLSHIIPKKDHPHYQFDQLWLGTKKAIKLIQSVEFINKEGVHYEKIPLHQ